MTSRLSLALIFVASTAAGAFAQGPPPPLGPPPPPPPANPQTPEKISLGGLLYWDEQLSSTKTVACATCHIPEKGGSDPRSVFAAPNNVNPGPDGLFGFPFL